MRLINAENRVYDARILVGRDKIQILSKKEQMELARKAQAGDTNACAHLVLSMTSLIEATIWKEYKISGADSEDIKQKAYLRLLEVFFSDRFDPAYHVKPSTYAVPIIRSTIQQYLLEEKEAIKLNHTLGFWVNKVGLNPNNSQLRIVAAKSGYNFLTLLQAFRSRKMLSLDRPIKGSLEVLEDTLQANPEYQMREIIRVMIQEAFQRAYFPNKRDRFILNLRYGLEGTSSHKLAEIADYFNISGERVRQIIKRGRQRIKNWLLCHPKYGSYLKSLNL